MSVDTSTITTQKYYPPPVADDEEIYYPSTIPNYMPENNFHFVLIANLAVMLQTFLQRARGNYVFGDIMFYYEEGNPRKFIAPDLMVCLDKEKEPSKGVYKLWEERHVPQVVIEIASESTWLKDVSSKLAIYQKLGVKEYYVFDIERTFLPQALLAYRMETGILTEVEIPNKRILSESLGLELVDTGETLRFFNPETNEFLMTMEEMAQELTELKKQKNGN